MKKLLLLAVILLGVSFSGLAQDKKRKKEMHQCTEMCKDGKHVYTHDEKKKMKKDKHQCTEMCKDEKHVYAHGEKKHKCSEVCHKTM